MTKVKRYDDSKQWYAIHTYAGYEEQAAEQIQSLATPSAYYLRHLALIGRSAGVQYLFPGFQHQARCLAWNQFVTQRARCRFRFAQPQTEENVVKIDWSQVDPFGGQGRSGLYLPEGAQPTIGYAHGLGGSGG